MERDAEYMTVPVHEEADSGDIDFDVEEETDQGQRGRKEDGVGLCDDKHPCMSGRTTRGAMHGFSERAHTRLREEAGHPGIR